MEWPNTFFDLGGEYLFIRKRFLNNHLLRIKRIHCRAMPKSNLLKSQSVRVREFESHRLHQIEYECSLDYIAPLVGTSVPTI